jgi:hypothetical protein
VPEEKIFSETLGEKWKKFLQKFSVKTTGNVKVARDQFVILQFIVISTVLTVTFSVVV